MLATKSQSYLLTPPGQKHSKNKGATSMQKIFQRKKKQKICDKVFSKQDCALN